MITVDLSISDLMPSINSSIRLFLRDGVYRTCSPVVITDGTQYLLISGFKLEEEVYVPLITELSLDRNLEMLSIAEIHNNIEYFN